MPMYDYRCNQCGRTFGLFYKSYKDYETAVGQTCPNCASTEVIRRISRVTIAQPSRDLSGLSANEMLSVLDSGDSREVGQMFQQVADSAGGDLGETYNIATKRLLKGESIDRVERDLAASTGSSSDD